MVAKLLGLLENAATFLGCQYLSDLHYLIPVQRYALADYLERCAPEQHTLFEWNDVLDYLTGKEAQPSADIVKEKLVETLRMNRRVD